MGGGGGGVSREGGEDEFSQFSHLSKCEEFSDGLGNITKLVKSLSVKLNGISFRYR